MKKYISLVCGAVLLAALAVGCSGAFGFDGKDGGLGADNSNPFKGTTWEYSDADSEFTLEFTSYNACRITEGAERAAGIARAAVTGQINAGTYSYTWKLNDDGSFTATLKVYGSDIVYALFTITASGANGTLTVDSVPYSFKRKGSTGTETDADNKEPSDDNETWVSGYLTIKDNVVIKCDKAATGTINIPHGVTGIAASAFEDCISIKEVVISSSVIEIGYSAFGDCTSLERLEIPEGVTVIEAGTFKGCTSLADIVIPNSVTEIGASAFAQCASLVDIAIPNKVTEIENSAFRDCTSLERLEIPEGVTIINGYTFAGCTSLVSVIIPDSVNKIDYWAFQHCTSLKLITIPENVTVIDGYAFEGCKALIEIEIPRGITKIGDGAFRNCSSLKTIIVGDGLPVDTGDKVFEGCKSVTDVYTDKTTTWPSSKAQLPKNTTIHGRDGTTLITG